jgi:hypothetical protein
VLVIDTPPSIAQTIAAVIAVCDRVAIRVRPSPNNLPALGGTIELARRGPAGGWCSSSARRPPDWPNIAEDIESVGSEQRHAVESLLLQALLHRPRIEAWPSSRDVPHRRSEARLFQAQTRRRLVPSMRQRIDVIGLCHDALRALPETLDDQPPLPVPEVCTATLDGLLAED